MTGARTLSAWPRPNTPLSTAVPVRPQTTRSTERDQRSGPLPMRLRLSLRWWLSGGGGSRWGTA